MASVLDLYEKLKPKLGEDEARSPLEYVETSIEQRAATKADLQEAAASLREEIHRVESGLRQEIQDAKSGLRQEIESVKVDLIKWSFGFWVGAIALLSGIMFALLRAK